MCGSGSKHVLAESFLCSGSDRVEIKVSAKCIWMLDWRKIHFWASSLGYGLSSSFDGLHWDFTFCFLLACVFHLASCWTTPSRGGSCRSWTCCVLHSKAVFLFKARRRDKYLMFHLCLKVFHHYRQCLCAPPTHTHICMHFHLTSKCDLHSSACESTGACVPGKVEAWHLSLLFSTLFWDSVSYCPWSSPVQLH